MSLRTHLMTLSWCVGGFVLGAAFPIVALVWATEGDVSVESVRAAHADQPVLVIVDTAPIVLALAGWVVGSFHERLRASYQRCEDTVRARTAELQAANNRLVEAIAAKDRFVSMVSHELRNPITAVVGFAQTLLPSIGTLVDEDARRAIGLIADQGAEAAHLLEDLLVASRAETASLSIEQRSVDLGEIARDCLGVVLRSGSRRQNVAMDICESPVLADPGRVRQIIRNLLTNADRYGGSRVVVRTGVARDRGCYLQVRDDGPGVPPEDAELIFQPYTQSDSSGTASGSVGIGLSVSRTLARRMGGDLTYRREAASTVFELTLPAVSESELPAA